MKAVLAILLWLSFAPTQTKHVVSLHWNASTTPNVVYNVYRAPAGGAFQLLNPGGFIGTTFNDTSVRANHSYAYYVTASDGVNESTHSNTMTFTVPN